jgi:hypothetical protein
LHALYCPRVLHESNETIRRRRSSQSHFIVLL